MNLITTDSLVFDIGANVGQSALRFFLKGAKHTVSVEPCLENYMALHLSSIPRNTPIHAACWFKPELTPVHYAVNQPGLSTLQRGKWSAVYNDAYWGEPQYVPTVTLDMLAVAFGIPDVVKVDVEGAELPVLQGMNFKPRVLFFEFHLKTASESLECLKLAQKMGFERAHYVRDDIDLETEPTMALRDFIPRWTEDEAEWGNITLV